ncbi:MAG: hypothetical protein WCI39_08195, partial [Gallionellaceae bacterium]
STAQHSTAQHSTAQHSTAQHLENLFQKVPAPGTLFHTLRFIAHPGNPTHRPQLIRHSGAGRNPAVLFKAPLGFVLTTQAHFFFNWIPACAGMTLLNSSNLFPPFRLN